MFTFEKTKNNFNGKITEFWVRPAKKTGNPDDFHLCTLNEYKKFNSNQFHLPSQSSCIDQMFLNHRAPCMCIFKRLYLLKKLHGSI